MAESVKRSTGPKLVYLEGPWGGADELATLATLGWVDRFKNTRIPSLLDHRAPAEGEVEHYRGQNTPRSDCSRTPDSTRPFS